MSGKPKRHHYLPRSYLVGFSDSSGKVAVHDRQRGTFKLQLINDTGLEGHLYSYVLPDGSKEAPTEVMLSKIDSEFPALRSGLEKSLPRFSPQEIEPFFAWVAALAMRVPKMLSFFKRKGHEAIEARLSQALASEKSAQAFVGEVFGADFEVAKQPLESIKAYFDELEAKHPRSNAALRVSVEMMAEGHRLLCQKANVTVLRAPVGKKFLTCDIGVLVHHPLRPNGLVGYLGPGSVVLVPLSSNTAVELTDGPFAISCKDLSREDLNRINFAVAKSSRRFVIGDSLQRLRSIVTKARLEPSND